MSFANLDIRLQRSKLLIITLTMLYLLAVSVLFCIQIWLWVKIAILLLIAFSWYRICWRILLFKMPNSISRIVFLRGDWCIHHRAGISEDVCLLGKSYLSAWFVILHFFDIESRAFRSIVLARDSVDPQTFRRLHAILKTALPWVKPDYFFKTPLKSKDYRTQLVGSDPIR